MTTPLKLLIVEDWPQDAELLLAELTRAGYDPVWQRVETEPDFLAALNHRPDIILSDYSLPQFNGLRALKLLHQSGLIIPFNLVSGSVGEDVAVEAMRQGAADYLLKDRIGRLGSAVERALEQQRLRLERQQTETSLKLFRTLIDQSNDGIEVIDPQTGRFLDVNETTCQRLGYRREELLTMGAPDVIVGKSFANWDQSVAAVREQGFKIIEPWQRRKDGSTFQVEINVRLVRMDREYLIAVVRDITERRQVEQELKESQALYHSLVSQLPAGVFRKDRAGRFVLANPWFCQLRGLTDSQIVGRTSEELAAFEAARPNPSSPEMLRLLRQGRQDHEDILRSGHPLLVEETHAAPGGGQRHVHVVKTAVFGPDGQITGTQGIQFDVTELKQAQSALNLFRTLIDQSNDGIEVIDPATGRFLDINETACRRLGYTREELLAMSVPEIETVAVNASSWQREIGEIRAAGSRIIHGRHQRKDGSTFPVEVSVSYVRLDRDYLIAAVRDVTERQQAEAEQQAQLRELQRWHEAMLGREDRILELKREVNELLAARQEPPRYAETASLSL